MELSRRDVLRAMGASVVVGPFVLVGCGSDTSSSGTGSSSSTSSSTTAGSGTTSGALALGRGGWSYDATNDVYYQLGRSFAATPAAAAYETLGIYVPGKYLNGTKGSDGTYTATVNHTATVAGYTATTAPIVMPVNTPGYSAQKPPTSYSYDDVASYLKAGFVYVAAGLRGRDTETSSYTGNAPWGVTDLKAAVRYLRYNAAVLPGDPDRIFVFGHSGGGAQSSVMGSSGDSPLYTPYLKKIGAAMTDANGKSLSDAIAGVMAWCPITSLDFANAAYEWNMGQFASTGTRSAGTWTKAYSQDLATAFAGYVNQLGLTTSSGAKLALTTSSDGQYLAGTYYDHLISVIQGSLNDFLKATTFPYTPASNGGMSGMRGGTPPSGGSTPSGAAPSDSSAGSSPTSTTYATVQDYIDHLNSSSTWVSYDQGTRTAKVLNLGGFVTSQKNASKDVGAFDGTTRQATENAVLGLGSDGLHFAAASRDVIAAGESRYAKLTNWTTDAAASNYTSDFAKTDSVGTTVPTRLNMYNPMYFLSKHYEGYKTSKVAPNWRIRTGIMQGDAANTVEINLALALANIGIRNVDFATIWGQAHIQAELTGTPVANFIAWVDESVA